MHGNIQKKMLAMVERFSAIFAFHWMVVDVFLKNLVSTPLNNVHLQETDFSKHFSKYKKKIPSAYYHTST